MSFIKSDIEKYCVEMTSNLEPECQSIVSSTRKNEHWSQMLSGPLELSIIGLFIKVGHYKRILEFGSYTGLSALAMASELPEDGELVTVDKDQRVQQIAQANWKNSNHAKKIIPLCMSGQEAIKQIEGDFDLIFIDADKANYLEYFLFASERLNPRGLIIIDNALWKGKVLDSDSSARSTLSIQRLNNYIQQQKHLKKVLLPIGDGLFIVTKI
jgi:caffeoyl-CoA O-methyltransferase